MAQRRSNIHWGRIAVSLAVSLVVALAVGESFPAHGSVNWAASVSGFLTWTVLYWSFCKGK